MILGMRWGDIETKWANYTIDFCNTPSVEKVKHLALHATCISSLRNQANQLQLLIWETLQNCRIFSIFAKKAKARTESRFNHLSQCHHWPRWCSFNFNPWRGHWWPKWWDHDTWGIGEAAGNDDNLGKSHGHMAPKPQQTDALDKWDRWYRCLDWSGEGTLCNRHLQGSKSLQFRNTCHHEWPFPPENPTPAEIPAMVVSTRPHGPCTTFVSAISAGERPRSRSAAAELRLVRSPSWTLV